MSDVKPKRIQRKRTKGWKMPPNTVYVGRPTKWGNPYRRVHEKMDYCSWFRDDLIAEAKSKSPRDPNHPWSLHFWKMARQIHLLRGKNLACWCSLDQPCHADVLLELANR